MKLNAVILMGLNDSRETRELFFDLGFTPIVRDTIEEVVVKIRRGGIDAIVVNRRKAGIDVLELILNVRDVDEDIAMVIIGESDNEQERRVLNSRRHTYVFPTTESLDDVAREVEKLLQREGAE